MRCSWFECPHWVNFCRAKFSRDACLSGLQSSQEAFVRMDLLLIPYKTKEVNLLSKHYSIAEQLIDSSLTFDASRLQSRKTRFHSR